MFLEVSFDVEVVAAEFVEHAVAPKVGFVSAFSHIFKYFDGERVVVFL